MHKTFVQFNVVKIYRLNLRWLYAEVGINAEKVFSDDRVDPEILICSPSALCLNAKEVEGAENEHEVDQICLTSEDVLVLVHVALVFQDCSDKGLNQAF